MITVDCTNPTLSLDIAPCGAAAPSSVVLSRRYDQRHELDFIVEDGQILINALPEAICDGVWNLSIQTECGCFMTPVNIIQCRAPRQQGKHTPTNIPALGIECCPEDDQP